MSGFGGGWCRRGRSGSRREGTRHRRFLHGDKRRTIVPRFEWRTGWDYVLASLASRRSSRSPSRATAAIRCR